MLLLPDTLTVREASAALRMLKQGLHTQTGDLLVVDAAGLQRFDSAALAVLLECERLAAAWGKRFEVRHLPPRLAELAQVYGVAEIIPTPA